MATTAKATRADAEALKHVIEDPRAIQNAYETGRIRKILVMRISRVGDLLFTTPAIRCLKARFPKAELHALTNPYSRDVLRGSPHVQRVHLLNRKGLGWKLFRLCPPLKGLREAAIDLVVPFRWRPEYKTLLGRLRPPFVFRMRYGTQAAATPHMADQFTAGLAALGVSPDKRGMELFWTPTDEDAVDSFRNEHGLLPEAPFVFHAGSNQTKRRRALSGPAKRTWPVKHWAALARRVFAETGQRPILTGFSSGDLEANALIMKQADLKLPQFTRRSLNQLAALLSRAGGFVCGDTGPLHVASAVSVPTIALFGPSRPGNTGPYRNAGGAQAIQKEIECGPCKGLHVRCTNNLCMQWITPEEVGSALLRLQRKSAAASQSK
jgi:ADP-heptose:LPS heptosyltransferase